jgi:hypothetical protein
MSIDRTYMPDWFSLVRLSDTVEHMAAAVVFPVAKFGLVAGLCKPHLSLPTVTAVAEVSKGRAGACLK